MVSTVQHACDRVLKVLKLSTYRLQIFLVEYEYLQSLQLYEDQGIRGKLKKHVQKHVVAILATYVETRLLVRVLFCKEDLKDFEAMTEKTDFSPSKLVTFPTE